MPLTPTFEIYPEAFEPRKPIEAHLASVPAGAPAGISDLAYFLRVTPAGKPWVRHITFKTPAGGVRALFNPSDALMEDKRAGLPAGWRVEHCCHKCNGGARREPGGQLACGGCGTRLAEADEGGDRQRNGEFFRAMIQAYKLESDPLKAILVAEDYREFTRLLCLHAEGLPQALSR